ncbi:hypothetical protein BD560DRAFT_436252 [Blakeslea trispora]|nr:hypothetical protein BD560DRAFT_436252 [Blakeslea trispora]
MDISKMCIDSSEGNVAKSPSTSSERDSLPSLSELPLYNNPIVNNQVYHSTPFSNTSPTQNQKQHYQQQYQLQHQYLKPYTHSPLRSASEDIHMYSHPSPHMHTSPHPTPPPTQASFQKNTSKQPSALPPLINRRPLAPHIVAQAPPPLSTLTDDGEMLRLIIDQCTMIHQKVGKYRVDPLRESERNQIIDEVFGTTEILLRSLKDFQARQQRNSLIDDDMHNHNRSSFYDDDVNIMNEATSEEYKMIRQARNLQESTRPKYRRRSKRSMVGQRCHSCNTSETPEWRRGPDGARTLCNACGLHYSKLLRKGSLTVQTHNYMLESTSESNRIQPTMPYSIQQRKSSPHLPTEPTSLRITELKETEE